MKQQRADKETANNARLRAALSEKALEKRVLNSEDGQQIVFRRIVPSAKVEASLGATQKSDVKQSEVEQFIVTEELAHDSISLAANVYGKDYSEIVWRDMETGQTFTVWTNVNLNYLGPITTFESGDVRYDYFGFVTAYSYEAEQKRLAMTTEQGALIESNWKTPPVVFSAEQYEYFVDMPLNAQAPEKLYRQLDALFGYYLGNLKRLEIGHKNARLLQAARKKDLEENPPEKPKQIIMNYTPLRGKAAE